MKSGMYLGPDEFIRRYMAGLTVTYEDMFLDGSPWTVKMVPRWHLARLADIAGKPVVAGV